MGSATAQGRLQGAAGRCASTARRLRSWAVLTVVAGLLQTGSSSASSPRAAPGSRPEAPSPVPRSATERATQLTALHAAQVDGRVRITLRGDGRLEADRIEYARDLPPRLVLDLPGVSASVPAVTRVAHEDVVRVRVGLNSRSPLVTRVVFDLGQQVPYEVSRGARGDEIVLVFGARRTDAPTARASAVIRANLLAAVRATEIDGRVHLTLHGNGRLEPAQVEYARDLPPRLVVDLPGVGIAMPAVTRVAKDDVVRVRVGTNSLSPLVTRVVVDLQRQVPYAVSRSGTRGEDVVIALGGESSAGPPGATPARRSAVQPAKVAADTSQPPVGAERDTSATGSGAESSADPDPASAEARAEQGGAPWMRSTRRVPADEPRGGAAAKPRQADRPNGGGPRLVTLRSFRAAVGVGYDAVTSEVRDGFDVNYENRLTSPLATIQGSVAIVDPGILTVDALADLRFDWRDYQSDVLADQTQDSLENYRVNLMVLSARRAPLHVYFERASLLLDQVQNSTLTGDLVARSQTGRRSTRGFSWDLNASRFPHVSAAGYTTARTDAGSFLGGWDTDGRQDRLEVRADRQGDRLRYEATYSHEGSRTAYPLAGLSTAYGVDVARANAFVRPAQRLTLNLGTRLTRFGFDRTDDVQRARSFAGVGGDAGLDWQWSPRWRMTARYSASGNESELALSELDPSAPADRAGLTVRRNSVYQDYDSRVTFATASGSAVAAGFVRGLALDPLPIGSPTLDTLRMVGLQADVRRDMGRVDFGAGAEGAVGRSSSNRGDEQPYREVSGRARVATRLGRFSTSANGGLRQTTGSYFYPVGGQAWNGGIDLSLDASRYAQLRASATRSFLSRDVRFQYGDDRTDAYVATVVGPFYQLSADYADTRSSTSGLFEAGLLVDPRPEELLAARPDLLGFLYASRQLRRGAEAKVTPFRGLAVFGRGRLDRLELPTSLGSNRLDQKAVQAGAILGVRQMQVEIGWEYLDYWSTLASTANRRFYVRARRDIVIR